MTECSRGFKHQTMNEVAQLWCVAVLQHHVSSCHALLLVVSRLRYDCRHLEKITMTEYQQITSLVFPIGPGGAQVQCYYS